MMGWLNPLGLIADELVTAYEAKQKALTDEARLRADVLINQLEARQSVLIAEQGSWLTKWIRPALALPIVVYFWKIIIWDKVLKMGVTDPIGETGEYLMVAVVGAYFVTRPFEKIGKAWIIGRSKGGDQTKA